MEELETNIITPSDYNSLADLPKDLRKMAQSIQHELNKKLEEEDLNEKLEELQPIFQEYENKITELEEVNQKQNEMIESLESELPDKEVQGSRIEIKDGVKARASILPMGNTEQESREGYNLFNENDITLSHYLTPTNGALGTSDATNTSGYIPVIANKTYKIVFDYTTLINEGKRGYCYFDTNKTYLKGSEYSPANKSFTVAPTEDGFIRFAYDKNCTNIMMYEGTQDKPYEQYGAMPSKDYPSPIKVVEGSYANKIQNKNLLVGSGTVTSNGLTSTFENGKVTLKGTIEKNYANIADFIYKKIEKGTTLIFSRSSTKEKTGIERYNLQLTYEDNTTATVYGNTNQTGKTFTLSKSLLKYRITTDQNTVGTTFDVEEYIQLEFGNVATEIVQAQEQVKNLDFPEGIKLAKEDELEFSYTEKNGYKTIDRDSVYHNRNSEESILDGVTKLFTAKSGTTVNNMFVMSSFVSIIDRPSSNNVVKEHFCNYFKSYSTNYIYGNNIEGSSIRDSGDIAIGFGLNSEINTVELANNWLKEKNTEGNPVKIRYPLATPIKTQITDETFISQLEDLLNSETYKGVTHITTSKSSTEVADLILKVDYKQSNSSRIDALEKAILSLGGNI